LPPPERRARPLLAPSGSGSAAAAAAVDAGAAASEPQRAEAGRVKLGAQVERSASARRPALSAGRLLAGGQVARQAEATLRWLPLGWPAACDKGRAGGVARAREFASASKVAPRPAHSELPCLFGPQTSSKRGPWPKTTSERLKRIQWSH